MTTTFAHSAPTSQPSGASLAFTTEDPVVAKAKELMSAGKFSEADAMLAADDSKAADATKQARAEMRELIQRTRREYSINPEQMLAKIRKSIPDVTPDDVAKWTEAGVLGSRQIDGKTLYYRREPVNLFRFSDDAKKRRDAANPPQAKPDGQWTLEKHIRNVLHAATESMDPEVYPVHHKITFTLTIPANTKGVKAGSLARVWLPYPQEYRQQRHVKLIRSSPENATIAPNGEEGKTIGGGAQRTIYFEKQIDDPAKDQVFVAEYEYDSYAYYPRIVESAAKKLPDDWGNAYLDERPPHIVFTPELKATVTQLVGGEFNPLRKAQAIYNWIDENIKYCAEEEYSTIPSFSQKALRSKKGDCGIQSMLFITMCRYAGVPARWQSGWETKPIGTSQHDWAEFYVEPWGWLPADPSYGIQRESLDPNIRNFYFGHQDALRLIVNLDYGRELVPPKQSLRSEPADFQVGEVEIDGKNLYYDDFDYNFQFTQDPPQK
ncbi:MAG TPA: transglutaminase domain-containing protein [Tepidisphaeraceae bacterium]|jgi:transglutaminase-like putative cysteine protease|nr:transglutaminase domain-containing protein [Tepidisphaeraceae bacterium]